MAVEVGLVQQLARKEADTISIFGELDFITHQLVASPYKPIEWMDKIDVFGYSFIKGCAPSISRFLVCEIKKDMAFKNDIKQIMKYVDWVKESYAEGDYSTIDAFIVASSFEEGAMDALARDAKRIFTMRHRDVVTKEWLNLKLVTYKYNEKLRKLDFKVSA
jgi:hypothetical protein